MKSDNGFDYEVSELTQLIQLKKLHQDARKAQNGLKDVHFLRMKVIKFEKGSSNKIGTLSDGTIMWK